MVKVLYIGHYREQTGWGQGTRDYLSALIRSGVEVACRPIVFGGGAQLSPELEQAEQLSTKNADYCIQHVLPHLMVGSKRFKKNIGMFYGESTNICYTSWFPRLNLMDELWVTNFETHEDLLKQSVTPEIHTVPQPINIDRYKTYPVQQIPQLAGRFVFYFIGELSIRKRISAIVRAFHTEFTKNEPVALLLKLHKPGLNSQQVSQETQNLVNNIKNGLKLYPDINQYHSEIIISNYLPEDVLMGLHHLGDCYVLSSYGESVNLPCIDAICMGNQAVYPNTGGLQNLNIAELAGTVRPCMGRYESIINMNETFFDLNTAHEKWFDVDLEDLKSNMRAAYQRGRLHPKDVATSRKIMFDNFEYETIGNKMKGLLC